MFPPPSSWSGIRRASCATSTRRSCSGPSERQLVRPRSARDELHLDVVPAFFGRAVAEPVGRAGTDRLCDAEVLLAQVVDALRARLPEQQVRGRTGGPVEGQLQLLALGQVDAVDIDLVVPEVD